MTDVTTTGSDSKFCLSISSNIMNQLCVCVCVCVSARSYLALGAAAEPSPASCLLSFQLRTDKILHLTSPNPKSAGYCRPAEATHTQHVTLSILHLSVVEGAKVFIFLSVLVRLYCLVPGEAAVPRPLRSWHMTDSPISCSQSPHQFMGVCLAGDAITNQKSLLSSPLRSGHWQDDQVQTEKTFSSQETSAGPSSQSTR